MTHLQVFLLAKYGKELMGLSDEAIQAAIKADTKLPITATDVMMIQGCPPSKKQIVHGLADIGLSQQRISQLTGLKQPTVSYHLRTSCPDSYRNVVLDALATSYKMNLPK